MSMTDRTKWPCHASEARAREFGYLAHVLHQSFVNCGFSHAVGVALHYDSEYGHNAAVLLRVACEITHAAAEEAIIKIRGKLTLTPVM